MVKLFHARTPLGSSRRTTNGNLMVEALVASLIAGFIIMTTAQTLMLVRKTGSESRGAIIAAAISQEVIDELRVLPYATVSQNTGLHYPVVNGNSPVSSEAVLFPRPLLQDFATLDYTANGSSILMSNGQQKALNTFRTYDPASHALTDTVTVDIENAPGGNGLSVAITVCYQDGGTYRTWKTASMITPNGLNG